MASGEKQSCCHSLVWSIVCDCGRIGSILWYSKWHVVVWHHNQAVEEGIVICLLTCSLIPRLSIHLFFLATLCFSISPNLGGLGMRLLDYFACAHVCVAKVIHLVYYDSTCPGSLAVNKPSLRAEPSLVTVHTSLHHNVKVAAACKQSNNEQQQQCN